MNPTDVTPRRVISSSAAKTGGILDSPEKDHWYLVLGVKEPIVLDFGATRYWQTGCPSVRSGHASASAAG